MSAARKEWAGNAPLTTLTGSMSAGSPAAGGTFSVASGTGYPTGLYSGGFVVIVDRGTSSEEKILCSARSGSTFTVATSGRGWDGTTAVAHAGGVTTGNVEHVVDADTVTDLSAHVYDTTRDDHTQYQKSSLLTTQGDIPYGTAASTWARLAKGTARQALMMNAGATAPSWGDSLASLLTAKGSIPTASAANTPAALAVGSDFQHFRARAAATNGNEWATLGSSATVVTSQTTASATYTDLATSGPAVTVTTGATALVMIGFNGKTSVAGNSAFMSFAVSGATTFAGSDAESVSIDLTNSASVARFYATGLTPGSNTFTAKYRVVGGSTGTFALRDITVIPL